jgi:hypothetical protein
MAFGLRTAVLLGVASFLFAAVVLPGCSAATDRMSYLDNGVIRIGVDLDLGGAITYLWTSASEGNLVNSADWGRQIQMSHYSGPVPFTPHGKQPDKAWAGLGWNPIQSGDCFGNRSRVIAYRNDGKMLYVKCIPMQWPLNNEPGECTYECWIRLEANTAHVRCRLLNHRSDHTQYPGRGQELPAVYTNGPWYRLMTYVGDRPFTGDAIKQMPAAFPWTGWLATENWAALVDDNDWGLGVWHPGVYSFIGGFAGTPGKGGPKDGPTGYIAPIHEEIIDHNIDYEYSYVLIVGSLTGIRNYVYAHASRPDPPVYRFSRDRQHWRYVNATDSGWPIRGELNPSLDQHDPQMLGPAGFWHAEAAPTLLLRAAFAGTTGQATVYWSRFDAPGFKQARSVAFGVVPDGRYRTYRVDLRASPEYHGEITGIRLDPTEGGTPGSHVRIKWIRFGKLGSY